MPQINIVEHEGEDFVVEPCANCGREYDQRKQVEDRSRRDFEMVWVCACETANEMYPWACDCGEYPCVTEYAFGCGSEAPSHCPGKRTA